MGKFFLKSVHEKISRYLSEKNSQQSSWKPTKDGTTCQLLTRLPETVGRTRRKWSCDPSKNSPVSDIRPQNIVGSASFQQVSETNPLQIQQIYQDQHVLDILNQLEYPVLFLKGSTHIIRSKIPDIELESHTKLYNFCTFSILQPFSSDTEFTGV